MAENNCRDLFDIYRLHAELADQVSQRREGANRLFVSLLTGLMVFLAALVRLGTGDLSTNAVMVFFGLAGVMLSAAWFVVTRSYRQLNTGKFAALHELEQAMEYPFFQREWELLREGQDFRRYWRLTVVETSLPFIFFLLFLSVIVFGAIR